MATAAAKLTVAEFESQYGQEKPYYEYWYGEAIPKSMPNTVHGLLQIIVAALLRQNGYRAGSEVKLKIDPSFHPVPDLIADRTAIGAPYPTKALEIVVEILSEDDPHSRVMTKLHAYESWGFQHIYLVDPATRTLSRWHDHRLEEVNDLAAIPAERIWSALDQELS
ncbi:MAG: Uma2 family endonuclease [Acidobacteriaceae bacterium]|nr:Uma2 family endonuclease [Acidobacteriaceae bacterium]